MTKPLKPATPNLIDIKYHRDNKSRSNRQAQKDLNLEAMIEGVKTAEIRIHIHRDLNQTKMINPLTSKT